MSIPEIWAAIVNMVLPEWMEALFGWGVFVFVVGWLLWTIVRWVFWFVDGWNDGKYRREQRREETDDR